MPAVPPLLAITTPSLKTWPNTHWEGSLPRKSHWARPMYCAVGSLKAKGFYGLYNY